jgi:two-component system chemotaxis response regulator CheB
MSELPGLLTRVVTSPAPDPCPEEVATEDPTEMDMNELRQLESMGRPSVFTCPECSGTLFELTEEGIGHFRCRVGHAYSYESLESSQLVAVEAAMWTALRTLEESLAFRRHLLERAGRRGLTAVAERYEETIREQTSQADVLRRVLHGSLK